MPKKEAKVEQLTAMVAAANDINAKIKLSQPIPVGAKLEQIITAIRAEGDHPEGGFYDTDKLSEETVATLRSIAVLIKSKDEQPAPAAAPKKNGKAPKAEKAVPAAKAEKPVKVPTAVKAVPAKNTVSVSKHKYPGTGKITLLEKGEQLKKKAVAGKRFKLYQNGLSVDAFLKAGGTRGDIGWDVRHEYISVK